MSSANRNSKNSTTVIMPESALSEPGPALIQQRLAKLAVMFGEHKNDQLMRGLLRLAIKCAQEGLIGV